MIQTSNQGKLSENVNYQRNKIHRQKLRKLQETDKSTIAIGVFKTYQYLTNQQKISYS
jgi:hypothetical protein